MRLSSPASYAFRTRLASGDGRALSCRHTDRHHTARSGAFRLPNRHRAATSPSDRDRPCAAGPRRGAGG